MKPWIAGARAMTRMAVAAVALGFVSAPPVQAFENPCSGCAYSGPLECGIALSFIIDGCCGSWVDGSAQCVPGYGYAVVCGTGRQCMCNPEGRDCDIRMGD